MTEAASLQSILDDPADDVVRLAFADWLMDQDDPAQRERGEFIRWQCELDGWKDGYPFGLPEADELSRRPADLARMERVGCRQRTRTEWTWARSLAVVQRRCEEQINATAWGD